jgi:hypothetical protein
MTMPETRSYAGPADPSDIDVEDVHEVLQFLIAIEPDPDDDDIDIATVEDYDAYMVPFSQDIDRAMATLRRFAEQRQPRTLQDMQEDYYRFTNDDRYLNTSEMPGVVTSALRDAWEGVGPWRK